MKIHIPRLLGLNAGYVDTTGFLALQGLFTAHVTGNFVTLGAALVQGNSGVLAKLLALPVFCTIVMLARMATNDLRQGGRALRAVMAAKVALLSVGAVLAIRFGPFQEGDGIEAVATGMVLVSAMAIQNLLARSHLSASPPTTLMTGSTTQMMIDIADLLRRGDAEAAAAALARLKKVGPIVATFALGCALGATAFHFMSVWCFVLPPLIALGAAMETSTLRDQ